MRKQQYEDKAHRLPRENHAAQVDVFVKAQSDGREIDILVSDKARRRIKRAIYRGETMVDLR